MEDDKITDFEDLINQKERRRIKREIGKTTYKSNKLKDIRPKNRQANKVIYKSMVTYETEDYLGDI